MRVHIFLTICLLVMAPACSSRKGEWRQSQWEYQIGRHKTKCFALPDNILSSIRLRDCAIYGTGCCLGVEKSADCAKPILKTCSLVDPNLARGFELVTFRRFPKYVEFYRIDSSVFGEWRVSHDTIFIDNYFCVENDTIRTVSQHDNLYDRFLIRGRVLWSIRKNEPDSAYTAFWDSVRISSTNKELIDAIDSFWLPYPGDYLDKGFFFQFEQIYGDENWWKNE